MKKGAEKTDYDRRRLIVPDERIADYMKERAKYARTVSCAVSVQLIALAFYFGVYILIDRDAFYSMSKNMAELIAVILAVIVAVCVFVVNYFTVIRSRKVYITRPDGVAIRDAREVVELAYKTARPILIYKITYSLVIMTVSGIVYIIFLMMIDNQFIAGIYGKIVCCLCISAAVYIAYPCVDRISCYRALLGQTHELSFDVRPNRAFMFILSAAVPFSICLWYAFRLYGQILESSWVIFPVTALFTLAISFLINWSVDSKNPDVMNADPEEDQ